MSTAPHRGDIWWADVPGDKVRPTEVELGFDDGLDRPCATNFDNVFTLRRDRLQERIGRLAPARHEEVCQAYRFAAGC